MTSPLAVRRLLSAACCPPLAVRRLLSAACCPPLAVRRLLSAACGLIWLFCALPSCAQSVPLPTSLAVGTDRLPRLLWNNPDANSDAALWRINADNTVTPFTFGPYPSWTAAALAVDGNNADRILWNTNNGAMSLWNFSETSNAFTQSTYGPYPGWAATSFAVGANNIPRVMWTNTNGAMALWTNADVSSARPTFGPYPGWSAQFLAVGPDNGPRVLWVNTSGQISLWANADTGTANTDYGPFPGYTPLALTVDVTSASHLLWNHPADSTVSLWSIAADSTYTSHNFSYPSGYTPKALSPYSLSRFSAPGGGNAPQNNYVNLLWANPTTGDALIQTIALDGTVIATVPVSHIPGQNLPPVSHGTYTVTYSGGTGMIGSGGVPHAFVQNGTVYSASITTTSSSGGSISAQCNGPLTATFTWVPNPAFPGSPSPAQVLVGQTCTASWSTNGAAVGFTGSCNNGLGTSRGPTSGISSDSVCGSSSTTITNPGQRFVLNPACNPSASVSSSTSQCAYFNASVIYSAFLVNASLTATSTVPLANWDATKPRYFSGTNCSATASAPAVSGYVTHVQLFVGGTLVKEYDDTGTTPISTDPAVIKSTGTNLFAVNLTVNFDSTHFSNNTNVPILMFVTDSGGAADTYSEPIAAKTYNQSTVYGNDKTIVGSLNQGQNRATSAQTQLTASNYTSFQYMMAHKSDILSGLPYLTAFYLYSHGADVRTIQGISYYSFVGDCWAFDNSPFTDYLFAASDPTGANSVMTAVNQKGASTPPYNFVYIDGCEVNSNPLMSQAFGITSTSIDQVCLGWDTDVSDDQPNTDWFNRFVKDLVNGMSISDAKTDADRMGTPHYLDIPTFTLKLAVFDPKGDNSTKLHGVYGGNLTQWFK